MRREVRERTVSDGLLGGDTRWLAVGALYWGAVAFRWAWRKDPEIAVREELKPGEQLVISYGTVPSRRERRRTAKAARRGPERATDRRSARTAARHAKGLDSRSARKARARAEAEAARRAAKRARRADKQTAKATRKRDRRAAPDAATMDG